MVLAQLPMGRNKKRSVNTLAKKTKIKQREKNMNMVAMKSIDSTNIDRWDAKKYEENSFLQPWSLMFFFLPLPLIF